MSPQPPARADGVILCGASGSVVLEDTLNSIIFTCVQLFGFLAVGSSTRYIRDVFGSVFWARDCHHRLSHEVVSFNLNDDSNNQNRGDFFHFIMNPVPNMIIFVSASITEGVLVRTYSFRKEAKLVARHRELATFNENKKRVKMFCPCPEGRGGTYREGTQPLLVRLIAEVATS